MALLRVADLKMSKRRNFKHHSSRERQQRLELKRQVLDSRNNSGNSLSFNLPKKKPVIVILYER